jgi:hypothetical protein
LALNKPERATFLIFAVFGPFFRDFTLEDVGSCCFGSLLLVMYQIMLGFFLFPAQSGSFSRKYQLQ